MPIQVIARPMKANTTDILEFGDVIVQRLVGIQKFKLSFNNAAKERHHVKRMSVGLVTNHSGNKLQVTPIVHLNDTSGSDVCNEDSDIIVVAMACVGTNDPNLCLAGGLRWPLAAALPFANPSAMQAGLGGFDMSFSDTAHHVQTADCWIDYQSSGAQGSGSFVSVTGQGEMHDASGHFATVEGTGILIAANGTEFGEMQPIRSLQKSTQHISFRSATLSCQPVLSGFKVHADKDTDVGFISAELTSSQASNGGFDITGSAKISWDGTTEFQNNALSHVTGFVIGY